VHVVLESNHIFIRMDYVLTRLYLYIFEDQRSLLLI
jgi:hypothetical protein